MNSRVPSYKLPLSLIIDSYPGLYSGLGTIWVFWKITGKCKEPATQHIGGLLDSETKLTMSVEAAVSKGARALSLVEVLAMLLAMVGGRERERESGKMCLSLNIVIVASERPKKIVPHS